MGLCGYFCEWANEIKAQKFCTSTMFKPKQEAVIDLLGCACYLSPIKSKKLH